MSVCARRARRQSGFSLSTHDDLGVYRVRGRPVGTEADEFDAHTIGVMAHDASGELADQHEFAQRRLDLSLERDAADRKILHLALDRRSVAAREARERS